MNIGLLSVLELSDKEIKTMIDYLVSSKDLEALPFLYEILGKDLLLFLDVFAGETIKIPTRQELAKIINYIIIYQYVKERGFSEESYQKAAVLFKKRIGNIKRIVEKVDNITSNIKNKYLKDSDLEKVRGKWN